MIETVFNGQDVFLLNDAPNFKLEYKTDFSSPTDVQSSLTARESRRPFASSLRVSAKFALSVKGSSLRTLQNVLRGLKAQPVLTPFWPAVSFWSTRNASPFSSGLYVAFKSDWSQYSIYEAGAEPGWPLANDQVAPLLWGFVKPSKDFRVGNVDYANVPVEFTESSPVGYALAFAAGAFVAGPKPDGYSVAPSLLPFKPNYTDVTESLTVSVDEKEIGFVREAVKTFYPQEVYRTQKSSYAFRSQAEIAALLSWYQTTGSQGESFWAVGAFAVGYLANDAAAGDVDLTWTDGNVQITDLVAAVLADGSIKLAKVTNVVGSVITVDASFGVALKSGQPFYLLNLARLDGDKLTLTWRSPTLATASLKWNEVRPEAAVPADETVGTTLGALPERAVLFDFWRDYGNGTVEHFYFTSYEEDVQFEGNVYKTGPFSVGDISTSLNLEDDSCEIDSTLADRFGNLFSANPMVKDVALLAEAPLNVKIYFADVFRIGTDPLEDVGNNPISDVGGSGIEGV